MENNPIFNLFGDTVFMKQYNKLVRDWIPDIIKESGRCVKYKVLTDDEYILELDKKLDEEVSEYRKSGDMEELADIMEVLFALCETNGGSIEELERMRKKKAEERGAFNDKIFLQYVE